MSSDMRRHRVTRARATLIGLAAAVGVAGAVGVWSFGSDDGPRGAKADSAAEPAADRDARAVSMPAGQVVTGGAPTHHVAIADRLKTFANATTEATFADVPFSDRPVALLLGGRLVKSVPAAELADPKSWTLDVDSYGGRQGPFSVLRSIAGFGDNTMSAPGPLSSCAESPATTDLRYDEHVILEPANVDACTTWFGVDIYLEAHRIVAVGLTFDA